MSKHPPAPKLQNHADTHSSTTLAGTRSTKSPTFTSPLDESLVEEWRLATSNFPRQLLRYQIVASLRRRSYTNESTRATFTAIDCASSDRYRMSSRVRVRRTARSSNNLLACLPAMKTLSYPEAAHFMESDGSFEFVPKWSDTSLGLNH